MVGGTVVGVYGIRESGDIYILVTEAVYNDFKNKEGWEEHTSKGGNSVLIKEPFDIGTRWDFEDTYNPDPNELIKNAEIVNGLPVVPLEEVIKYKRAFGREKDLRDIKLIKNYLKNNSVK